MNTHRDIPEFITIGSDFTDANRRFRSWYTGEVNVAGASTPALLTLGVTGQREENVADWLLKADSGDKVTVYLQDGVSMLKIMGIDAIERHIDYNGVLTATVDLTLIS